MDAEYSSTNSRLSTNNASSDGTYERRLSSDSIEIETTSIRWSTMRQIFAGNHLDPLFELYTHKTNHGYISTFLILMAALSFTHFFLVLGLNMEEQSLEVVTLDLITYIIVGILSIVGLVVSEKYIKERPKLLTALSAVAFVTLFVMDIIVPVYHFIVNETSYRPAYTTVFILSCYIFFNITSNMYSAILGFTMSAIHIIVLVFITYHADSNMLGERVGSDAVYLFCVNAFGIYFRMMTEIMKRRSFLDRRALVESTLKLKYEEEQGEQLIASVIPKNAMSKLDQYAESVRMIDQKKEVRPTNPWQLDIKQHSNVTILYADIVNYTKMTTTLKSLQLVETLNELFGRFDDASEELNVLRVKFLGDCYYCVAGLEPEIPNHAEASVDLGLRMIHIIQDVKKSRNLPIDMRIGIHSGDIYSGVIGTCKWQFDIWSNDVSIANRMETTGQPGKVHITRQTKDQLKKTYDITPSEAGENDRQLKQNNIETFLITPEVEEPRNDYLLHILRRGSSTQDNDRRVRISESGIRPNESPINERSVRYSENATSNGVRPSNARKRESLFIQNNRRPSGNPAVKNGRISARRRTTPSEISRRTAFMDSNIKRYNERLKETDDTIKKSIEELSLTKYDQWFKESPINPLTLTFKDIRKEMNFMKSADPLFKFYAFAVIVVLICIIIIHNVTKPEWSSPAGYVFLFLLIVVIVPLCWSNEIWMCCAELPKSDFMRKYFLNCSQKINENVYYRMLLYIVMWCMCTTAIVLEMVECDYYSDGSTRTINTTRQLLFKYLFHFNTEDGNDPGGPSCVLPWHMTETIALAIICNFAFLKIHILLKLLLASTITVLYSVLLWNFDKNYFMNYETYNYAMKTVIAHILNIVFLTVTLHVIDRQTDFMNRLDHLLNLEQSANKEQALAVRKGNESLINNILPIHVAKLYLDLNRETGKLYYEEYSPSKPVAVMFAAIILQQRIGNELQDEPFLKCMNQRIEDFDQILMQKYENKIEKIKIANWTYMAACGLDPGKRESFFGHHAKVGERENIVVINLLYFAAEILKLKHDSFFDNQFKVTLRIGISHGEVTAGVVGSKKPLYDIWGDAVNMASRMESTGELGFIQVTENTANIVKSLGYSCQYRGKVKVKGKDSEIPTYFIDVDDDGKLVKTHG